jgi:hypothetical protein
MEPVYFVLDEQGEPTLARDVDAWTEWFLQADRGVARTAVTPDVSVLTEFSGFDVPDEGQLPRLYTTHVFGGVLDGEELQHPTREAALAAHAFVVAWCRIGSQPNFGVTADDIA